MPKRKTKIFLFLILSALIAGWAVWYFDNAPIVWEKTFDIKELSGTNFIQPTPDGGVVVGGTHSPPLKEKIGLDYEFAHPWAIKLDRDGKMVWKACLSTLLGYSGDSAAVLADGKIAVACTGVDRRKKHRVALLLCLDDKGHYEERGYYAAEPPYSVFFAKALAGGGMILLGAHGKQGKKEKKMPDGWVAELDQNLKLEWSRYYDGTKYGSFKYLYAASQGSYIVCATKKLGPRINDFWWLKINSKGKLLWDKVIHENEAYPNKFVALYGYNVLPNGDLLISGRYDDLKFDKKVGLTLVCLDGFNGDIKRAKLYLREGRDEVNTINLFPNKLVFYGGAYEPIYPTASSGIMLWIGDAKGNIFWEKKYSAGRYSLDYALKSVVMRDGGIVVVGSFHDKLWVAKILPEDDWLKSLTKNKTKIKSVPLLIK